MSSKKTLNFSDTAIITTWDDGIKTCAEIRGLTVEGVEGFVVRYFFSCYFCDISFRCEEKTKLVEFGKTHLLVKHQRPSLD